jgi:hypothetical protein
MSAMGQKRCFKSLPATSGLPPSADIIRLVRLIRPVQGAQIARTANSTAGGKAPSLPHQRRRETTRRANHLGNLATPLSSPSRKNILIFRRAESLYILRRPVLPRGVSRSSRTRGGMRWTQGALKTRALSLRTEKSCGPDAPVLASSSRKATFADDGGKKAGRRGEHEGSR